MVGGLYFVLMLWHIGHGRWLVPCAMLDIYVTRGDLCLVLCYGALWFVILGDKCDFAAHSARQHFAQEHSSAVRIDAGHEALLPNAEAGLLAYVRRASSSVPVR